CEALIRERTTVAPPLSWRSRLVQAGLMAALVIAVGAAVLLLGANRSEALLAAQINADHDRCFRIYVPPDAPALDAEAVEAELASRYGWNIHVPPSSEAAGLTLVYARRCLFG